MMKAFLRAALVLLMVSAFLSVSKPAMSVPRTLASVYGTSLLGTRPITLDPKFSVDYLGVSVVDDSLPQVRFYRSGRWTPWTDLLEDDVPIARSRTFSSLLDAEDADKFQLRGKASNVRAVAINTTDGPRRLASIRSPARATHLSQPGVVSRSSWGADESYRFSATGTETWPPAFYPTQKLIVHHTATQNSDPDPAATVRAIYRYHAIDKGWGDIGYNFLVDEQGRVYKGRYSGPGGNASDTTTGENEVGLGVTGAHTSGANSGTMGIALLGTLTTSPATPAARSTLVDHLAWESERHGLDAQGSSTYTNPVNGTQKVNPNISGHLDWLATECPGDALYADLPQIRSDTAAKVAPAPTPDTTSPTSPTLSAFTEKRKVRLTWTASSDTGGSGLAGYEIWRASSDAGPYTKIATTTSTAYADPIKAGRTSWYYVVAYDGAGNRAVSNVISARG